MKDENKQVTYSGEAMLSALQEIEYMLISLHRIGSYFADDVSVNDRRCYEEETTSFIDNSLVCERLAQLRSFLSAAFDQTSGDDDMDDIERVCADIPYWKRPGDCTEEQWLKQTGESGK